MVFTQRDLDYIIDSVPGDCSVYQLTGNALRILYCSEHVPALSGMSEERYHELADEDARVVVVENDRARVTDQLMRGIAAHEESDLVYRIVHETQGSVWVHAKAREIGTRDGDPVILAVFSDVSTESETYKTMLDKSDTIIYVSDAETWEVYYANKTAIDAWGSDEYVGKPCYEFVRGRKTPCPWCTILQIPDESDCVYDEHHDADLDQYLQVLCYRIAWYGRPAFVHSVRDITAQILGRQITLQLMAQGYESLYLIDVSEDSCAPYTLREDDIVDIGESLSLPTMLDHIASGHMASDAYAEFTSALSLSTIVSSLEADSRYTYPYDWSQDGTLYRKRADFGYLNDMRSTILFSISDITEQYRRDRDQINHLRSAMRTAEIANHAKSTFLSSISHDMRTPLNGIIGFTNLALATDDVDERQRCLQNIESSGTLLLGLLNDTLDLSRIESGSFSLNPTACDTADMLREVISSIQEIADEKGVTFVVDRSKGHRGFVMIDRLGVQKIYLNLLSNAIKFTPPGGTVTLISEDIDPEVDGFSARTIVEDTGIGIGEEFKPFVFDPFAQERDESLGDMTGGGTGLGLSIVKNLVELMGGRIEVESTKGEGARFTVYQKVEWVDAPVPSASHAPASASDDRDLSGRKVLLCEDNAMNAEIARALLERRGLEVTDAADGQQGLELFEASATGEFDLIVMDIRMPNMDGYAATKAIRALDRPDAAHVPIIAMTADAYSRDVQRCLEAGMDGHVSKPIDTGALFHEIARLI